MSKVVTGKSANISIGGTPVKVYSGNYAAGNTGNVTIRTGTGFMPYEDDGRTVYGVNKTLSIYDAKTCMNMFNVLGKCFIDVVELDCHHKLDLGEKHVLFRVRYRIKRNNID